MFTFTASMGIQNNVNKYDFLNAREYKTFVSSQAQNNWDNNPFPDAQKPGRLPIENAILNNPDHFGNGDTDWQDEITNKNAIWQQYAISLNGCSNNSIYSLSASFNDQEGVLIGNDFKRYNININLETEVNSWFKVGALVNYNYSQDKSSDVTNLLYSGNFRPDIPVYDEKGQGSSYEELIYGGRIKLNRINPITGDGTSKNQLQVHNMYGNLFGEVSFLKNF